MSAALPRLLIVGSSGHAKVVIDCVEKAGLFQIAGLIDRFRAVGETTMGYRVLGGEADLPSLVPQHHIDAYIVAIGDNAIRQAVSAQVANLAPTLVLACAVHPNAVIARDVVIGAGSVLMAGAVINSSTSIGALCIVNTRASIDHDCTLQDAASVAPGACIGGGCSIGTRSAIGLGANVIHRINIGADCVIGAGALVLQSVPDVQVAYGVPAKCHRSRQRGDRYL